MVTVKEVTTKRELRKFVDYPNKLYKDNPYFIPATYADDLEDWDRKKNPAFEYCDAKCFLAYRDGEIVGRIGAIISNKANEKFNNKRIRFSQVDFIDDDEVVDALFKAVEDFGRERGCTEIHGPLGFCDLDREGMLIKGFDRKSMFITYYNHPYYNEQLARLGFQKDVDWIEYLIRVPEEPNERLQKLADMVLRRNKLHIVEVHNRRQIKPLVGKVFNLLNEAYSHLYGVVPLNDRQVEKYTNKFLPLINLDYTSFVENEQGELVAFGVTAPSLANAFKKTNGRLFPTGAFRVLHALRHNDTLDLFLVAVRPDMQGAGINAILLNEVQKNAIKNGIKYAETGPELETNSKVIAQWKFFDTEQHKTRRCYVKPIAE